MNQVNNPKYRIGDQVIVKRKNFGDILFVQIMSAQLFDTGRDKKEWCYNVSCGTPNQVMESEIIEKLD